MIIKYKLLFSLVILSLILVGIWISNHKKSNYKSKSLPPVDITSVVQKDMPFILKLAGNAAPYQVVEVKSMVTGQLININFEDGQNVKTNDLLFEIDPRNFEYQLQTAEASLARDLAQLDNAIEEEQRYRHLLAEQAVSQEQYSQMLTNMFSLQATVAADKAMIETAILQLNYTKILAPINGRTGARNFDVGNLIEGNSDSMLTINQISPIYINFAVPEQYLSTLRKTKDTTGLQVTVKTATGEEVTDGKVVFIDNTINNTNGTIMLKATFANTDEILWPGQYVTVYLNAGNKKDAIVIPTKAIQTNQEGAYVFVIGESNKSEIRKIKTSFSDDNYTVISEGLQKGEKIVTNGQLRLTNGIEVVPTLTQEDF